LRCDDVEDVKGRPLRGTEKNGKMEGRYPASVASLRRREMGRQCACVVLAGV
jgi:hypothetical protein